MMPAAKNFDPVLGVDIHIIQPPGPVPPVPVPHPFIGFLMDPFDMLPVIGATVMVNGIPRAIAGTMGRALPPHFPIGGTFVKPPANECELFMGSSTVSMDGDAAGYMALPVLSCQDIGIPAPPRLNPKKKGKVKSLVLPTSVVLPIPLGPPVVIGGAPTISLFALGMRVGMAALGRGLRRLARTRAARRVSRALRRARQRAFRKLKPGFLKCRVLRGEPVDVLTGEVVVEQEDFSLPWRIPLEWTRRYGSQERRRGVCGVGWESPADARLEFESDGSVLFYDGGPGNTLFEGYPRDEPVMERVDGAVLEREPGGLVVRTKPGLSYHFPTPRYLGSEVVVQQISDRCGNAIVFERDEHGLENIWESSGIRIEARSQDGRIQELVLHHPLEPGNPRRLVRYEYADTGDLIAVYDALGNPYRFYYRNHSLVQHEDRNGLSFYYEYDEDSVAGRCVHSWGDGGLYDYRFEYFELVGERRITDSLGHVTTIVLNEDGLPAQEIDPLGGVTGFEYDGAGRATAVIDGMGNRTEWEYDERGNLVRLTEADGGEVLAEFRGDNRTVSVIDPNGNHWRQDWDSKGLLQKLISPRGAEWRYAHNPNGDLIEIVDPLGGATKFQRDVTGNMISVVNALGGTTSYSVDALGNILATRIGDQRQTTYAYDANGRLERTTTAAGVTIHYGYDNEGKVTRIDDGQGQITRLSYAGLGEVSERIQPDGSRVHYAYDTEERLIGITNERGQTYRLIRDPLGRVARQKDYWGGETRYAYDKAGNVVERIDPSGRITRYSYDSVGRLICEEYADGTKAEYRYDLAGNRVELKNRFARMTRAYDAEYNLVEESQGDFKVQYEYDPNGNRVARRSSHGNEIRFHYDPLNRPSSLHANDELVAEMEWSMSGDLLFEKLGERLTRQYRYDAAGRLIKQELYRGGRPIVSRSYRYDRAGNLLEQDASPDGRMTFRYDPRGRLKSYSDSEGRIREFLYDPAGDLLRSLTPLQDSTASRVASNNGAEYTFDPSGNLIARSDSTGDCRFEWDANNRLLCVENGRAEKLRMAYDASGRRVFKATNGERTDFHWDQDKLLSEQSATHGRREYIYYPDSFVPLAFLDDAGNLFFFQNDAIGLPHEICDASGDIVWSASYGPFGEVQSIKIEKIENPIRFQGQYFDVETGLSYTRYRYYDPLIGSFISQDPLDYLPGDNLYEYAPNPWSWIDPYGLACRRKPPNIADWELRDPNGRIRTRGREVSGGTRPGRRLSFPEQQRLHTEGKILARTENITQPGDIITIRGREPPCPMCGPAMERAAQQRGVRIDYTDATGRTYTYGGSP